jgi:hypothetical protein
MNRDFLQQLFVRVCRDSGFTLDWPRAAILTGMIAKVDPLMVWMAMDSETMDKIARGVVQP